MPFLAWHGLSKAYKSYSFCLFVFDNSGPFEKKIVSQIRLVFDYGRGGTLGPLEVSHPQMKILRPPLSDEPCLPCPRRGDPGNGVAPCCLCAGVTMQPILTIPVSQVGAGGLAQLCLAGGHVYATAASLQPSPPLDGRTPPANQPATFVSRHHAPGASLVHGV